MKEHDQILRNIQEEDEKAPIDIELERDMENQLKYKFKPITNDHTQEKEMLKEMEIRAMSMRLDGEGLSKKREGDEKRPVRQQDREIMARIGKTMREALKKKGTARGNQLFEQALEMYERKKNVVQIIYEEYNQNKLDHHTQDLTGLRFEEASNFIKKLIKRTQKILNEG